MYMLLLFQCTPIFFINVKSFSWYHHLMSMLYNNNEKKKICRLGTFLDGCFSWIRELLDHGCAELAVLGLNELVAFPKENSLVP